MDKKVVIGVDPDSTAHGVAIYRTGSLEELKTLDLMGIWSLISMEAYGGTLPLFSIENVMANQFVYARNQHWNKAAQSKIAMHIGRCQQAQVELMRMLDHLAIPYVLHKPVNGNWAKNKAQFERATGWSGRSNEDTRSAAYFGHLAL